MANKIGWCSKTWNPVWGCLNHCEYCYARGIARFRYKQMYEIEFNHWKKFHPILKDPFHCDWDMDYLSGLKDFKPTFLNAQFDKKLPKKPQRIFVGSMSEIYYWEKEWIEKVIEKIRQYRQHTFQFLTKFPEVYSRYKFPDNCWLGVTITNQEDIHYNWSYFFNIPNRRNVKFFFSFEPLLGEINLSFYLSVDTLHKGFYQLIDWVIIGAETGNRKGKVIPKLEWIVDIVEYCRNNKIPVYLKDSIIKAYPDLAFEYPNFHKFPGFYDKKENR